MFVAPVTLFAASGSPPPSGNPVALGSGGSTGPTIVITTGANAPAGSAIVYCGFSQVARLDAIASVTDSAGNTYTVVSPPGGSNQACYWAYALNITNLPNGGTITATLGRSSGNGSLGLAFVIPHVALTSALDVNVNSPDSASATGQTVASGVLAQASEIVLSAIGTISGDFSGVYNPSAPFTKIMELTQSEGGQVDYIGAYYDIVASTSSVNATMTNVNSVNVGSGAAVISLKLV